MTLTRSFEQWWVSEVGHPPADDHERRAFELAHKAWKTRQSVRTKEGEKTMITPTALVDSEYIRVRDDGSRVILRLPDGKDLVLTARQAATAKILEHGNATWSKIRFTVEMEADVYGNTAETVRKNLVAQMLQVLEEKDAKIVKLSDQLHDAKRRNEDTPPVHTSEQDHE